MSDGLYRDIERLIEEESEFLLGCAHGYILCKVCWRPNLARKNAVGGKIRLIQLRMSSFFYPICAESVFQLILKPFQIIAQVPSNAPGVAVLEPRYHRSDRALAAEANMEVIAWPVMVSQADQDILHGFYYVLSQRWRELKCGVYDYTLCR